MFGGWVGGGSSSSKNMYMSFYVMVLGGLEVGGISPLAEHFPLVRPNGSSAFPAFRLFFLVLEFPIRNVFIFRRYIDDV